jgi:hypothetical protein
MREPIRPRRRRCVPPPVRQILVKRSAFPWSMSDPPHWRAEIVLLTSPGRCMVSGRRCYPLALKLTNLFDSGRSVLVDLTVVAALVEGGLTILEAGVREVVDPEDDG